MSYWRLTDPQRRSFNGRLFRHITVDGPQELYSFSNRQDRLRKSDPTRPGCFDPMYFLTKSNLVEAIGKSSVPRDVFAIIQRGVGLCEDWGNDLAFVFILNIPLGLHIDAWAGLAKFQPQGRAKSGILDGGWLQYIVDIDERIAHYVDGPIRTGRK
jgi:hypothetical protein